MKLEGFFGKKEKQAAGKTTREAVAKEAEVAGGVTLEKAAAVELKEKEEKFYSKLKELIAAAKAKGWDFEDENVRGKMGEMEAKAVADNFEGKLIDIAAGGPSADPKGPSPIGYKTKEQAEMDKSKPAYTIRG